MELRKIASDVLYEIYRLRWIESIFNDGNWLTLAKNEFRGRGVAYFLILQSLCDTAKRSVDPMIKKLLDIQLFKGKLISENLVY